MDTQPAKRIWPPAQPGHYTTRGKNTTKSSAREDGHKGGHDSAVGITTVLWAGLSGDPIPVGARCFRARLDRPRGLPILLYNGYRVFLGFKAAGAWRSPFTGFYCWVANGLELYVLLPSVPAQGDIYLYDIEQCLNVKKLILMASYCT